MTTKQIWLDEDRNVVPEDKATILIENEYDADGTLVKSVTMKLLDENDEKQKPN
jgi:hypothetical protein